MSVVAAEAGECSSGRPQAFRAALIAVLIALVTAALWPAVASLVRNWLDMTTYRHSPLIALVSAYWLFERRLAFAATPWTVSWRALSGLVVALLLWRVAATANSFILMQITWPVVLLLTLHAAAGRQVARLAWLPVSYLYLGIPVWDQLLPALQWLTSAAAGKILALIGIDALVEGNRVTVPAGEFLIITDCAGERYLLVALAMGVLLAVRSGMRGKAFAGYVVLAAASAIVMNWIRVVTVIANGQLTNMQGYLVAKEHLTLGLVLFIALLAFLIWAATWFEPSAVPSRGEADAGHHAGGAQPAAALLGRAGIPLAVLLCTTMMWGEAGSTSAPAGSACLAAPPAVLGAWSRTAAIDSRLQPLFPTAATHVRASYASPQGTVEFYANLYPRQSENSKLIAYGNVIVGAGKWELSSMPTSPTVQQGWLEMLSAPRFVVRRSDQGPKWLIGYLYRIGAFTTSSEAVAQIAYGLLAQTGMTPSGIAVFGAACQDDCANEDTRLRRFWQEGGAGLLKFRASPAQCALATSGRQMSPLGVERPDVRGSSR